MSCLFLKPLIWPISTHVQYTISQHLCAVHSQSAPVCCEQLVSNRVLCTVSQHPCVVHSQHLCAVCTYVSWHPCAVQVSQHPCACTVSQYLCAQHSHVALYPARKQSETSVPKVDPVGHHQPACSTLPF